MFQYLKDASEIILFERKTSLSSEEHICLIFVKFDI